MGVPQPIELQSQTAGNFKYFYLKQQEPVSLEDSVTTSLRDDGVPKLSLLNIFSYLKYKKDISLEPTSLEKRSLGFHASEYPHYSYESNSDEENTSEKDFKIDISYHPSDVRPEETTGKQFKKPFDNTTTYPYSPIYSDTAFSIQVLVVCIFSLIYSILVYPWTIIFAFLVSILVIVSYIFLVMAKSNKAYIISITFLAVGLGLCIPSFFEATGKIVLGTGRADSTWDQQLVHGDNMILGWLFPLGQMGLYVDRSNSIGPYSFIGKLSTEIFQISYISYYIWGYFMEVYILWKYWKAYLSKDIEKNKEMPIWDQLLKMFICSWISTYFIVFSINLIFPAESPRVFLKAEYHNSLNGFGLAGFIRNKIENAAKGSFGSFPSGHIATSWAVAFASYKIVPIYGYISAFAAFLITIATMYLRYHYLVDFLAAVPVAFICLLFGGFYSLSGMKESLVRAKNSIKRFFSKNKKIESDEELIH